MSATDGKIELLPGSDARLIRTEESKQTFLIYTMPNPPIRERDTVAYTTATSAGVPTSTVVDVVPTGPSPEIDPNLLAKAGRILFSMLVFAVILESAFALLFNWSVFLEFFDRRGFRTIIMLLGAALLVWTFRLDFAAWLFDLYYPLPNGTGDSGFLSKLLTAMVLAGGSASVNQLMVALNIRQAKTKEQVAPKPPPTKAWVAFDVEMADASLVLEITRAEQPLAADSPSPLLGVVGSVGIWSRLKKYFWRDTTRFPMSKGVEVDPAKEYTFLISGRDADGKPILFDASGTRITRDENGDYEPTPRSYCFAAGAIVDFRVKT